MSQLSGSVTLDVELGRIGDTLAARVLAAVQEAGLVEQAAQKAVERLAAPPTLYDGIVVSCLRDWVTDEPGWYAFEFHTAEPGDRFVLYAESPDRYKPGASYLLAVALTPASGHDHPARATAPVPETAPQHRDGDTADLATSGRAGSEPTMTSNADPIRRAGRGPHLDLWPAPDQPAGPPAT